MHIIKEATVAPSMKSWKLYGIFIIIFCILFPSVRTYTMNFYLSWSMHQLTNSSSCFTSLIQLLLQSCLPFIMLWLDCWSPTRLHFLKFFWVIWPLAKVIPIFSPVQQVFHSWSFFFCLFTPCILLSSLSCPLWIKILLRIHSPYSLFLFLVVFSSYLRHNLLHNRHMCLTSISTIYLVLL